MSLVDKYRPKDFNEVIGNEEQVEILEKMIKKNNCSHVLLFQGEYGCGKTTLARIIASKLKCVGVNIIEINASNNRGIDTARTIQDNCMFPPLDGNNKIFIIDECHKTTKDFQNAMLKVLEEPPSYVYFMLCTTNPKELLSTFKSRCTSINVEKSTIREITKHLKMICEKEEKNISIKVLKQIAITSDGHVRDALKLLEKVFDIDSEEKALKIASEKLDDDKQVIELCRALLKKNNWNEVREILKGLNEDSEKIRYAVLGYMNSVLLNANSIDKGRQAAIVIEFFIEPFYNCGKAGLTSACFNIYSE